MVSIENSYFTLKLSDDCIAESLILKSTGEECLDKKTPFFSLTQERPFNNEIKLIYPNKRTTFNANRVRREGDTLIVGFELIAFEAVIEIKERNGFVAFCVKEFIVPEDAYGLFCKNINPPPISEVRLIQLSLKNRKNYGQWLNVIWDESVAVSVLSASHYVLSDSIVDEYTCHMYADVTKETKITDAPASLIVAPPDELLDCIGEMEEYFDLPKGVKSRQSDGMDESIYWTRHINPANIDKHIYYAKNFGFGKILIFINSFIKGEGYSCSGDYEFNDDYPHGKEDLKAVLERLKSEGIIPGIHFLHSHIGLKSKYVMGEADHRLNLTRRFTLAKHVSENDDIIYVEENPLGSPLNPDFQVLKFNGELIHYDSYETEYPYCFKGCKRGYCNTNIKSHSAGLIGGILDISEFRAESAYIDERTSLQDEVAEKIADIYNLGFEFVYFDGSEGVNPPFEFNIPNAQYKVYKRFNNAPLFCEGAAKSHFGWHILSGGNAFDVFPAEVFKEKIVEFPMRAATIMEKNFTRINFGWWVVSDKMQPDMVEFGTSKAAAFNCPVTIMDQIALMEKNPRIHDIFEVMSRWEDVRRKNWITKEQKEKLKNPNSEYILLLNEKGEYELTEYSQIDVANGDDSVSAFYFERNSKPHIVCWHKFGEGKLGLTLNCDDFTYEEQLGERNIECKRENKSLIIPVANRRYFSCNIPKDELIEAFKNSRVL